MSFPALLWCARLEADISPAERVTLLVLCEHHNAKTGLCFPAMRQIAKRGNITERSVSRSIKALEDVGLIAVAHGRSSTNGRGITNNYQLKVPRWAYQMAAGKKPQKDDIEAENPDIQDENVDTMSTEPGSNQEEPNTYAQGLFEAASPSFHPADKQAATKKNGRDRAGVAQPKQFDEWWALYPRKTAKPKAEQAYAKAVGSGVAEGTLMRALSTFDWPDNPDYIPYPASWLNARRWEDRPAERTRSASGGELHGNF